MFTINSTKKKKKEEQEDKRGHLDTAKNATISYAEKTYANMALTKSITRLLHKRNKETTYIMRHQRAVQHVFFGGLQKS